MIKIYKNIEFKKSSQILFVKHSTPQFVLARSTRRAQPAQLGTHAQPANCRMPVTSSTLPVQTRARHGPFHLCTGYDFQLPSTTSLPTRSGFAQPAHVAMKLAVWHFLDR